MRALGNAEAEAEAEAEAAANAEAAATGVEAEGTLRGGIAERTKIRVTKSTVASARVRLKANCYNDGGSTRARESEGGRRSKGVMEVISTFGCTPVHQEDSIGGSDGILAEYHKDYTCAASHSCSSVPNVAGEQMSATNARHRPDAKAVSSCTLKLQLAA